MECLCGSGPRVDARLVDSVEKRCSGLLIGKKSRPSELTEKIFGTLLTLCDIALRKCGYVRKVPEDSIWKR